jgi:acylphosphatase
MALSTKTSRLVVVGRVQGVGFRAFLAREATRLNLSGWARNRGVSEVEALVSGDAAAVARFVALARRGPAGARVDALREEAASEDPAAGFFVAPSV